MITKLAAFLILSTLGFFVCVAGIRGVTTRNTSMEVGNNSGRPGYILEYRGSDAVLLGLAEVTGGGLMVFSGLIVGLSVCRRFKAILRVYRNSLMKVYFWSLIALALLLFPPHKILSTYDFIFYLMFTIYHGAHIAFADLMEKRHGTVIQGMIALGMCCFIFLDRAVGAYMGSLFLTITISGLAFTIYPAQSRFNLSTEE
jgi:hypothetical protein